MTLHVAPVPKAPPARTPGRWRLWAQDAQGGRRAVSGQVRIDARADTSLAVDTGGIPYRRYVLAGEDGHFPQGTWLTEVAFTTVEAGQGKTQPPPRRARPRRRRPGSSHCCRPWPAPGRRG
ncbi:hypothetical protein [Roseateles chitinivorans]|uniref:hypothetical protein n=1 Tax=Roseateles chitinivorans TaxID=2917965 RepID=UPI003D67EE27